MASSLTQKKKASIRELCYELLQDKFLIIKKIARLLGKFTISIPAVRFWLIALKVIGTE